MNKIYLLLGAGLAHSDKMIKNMHFPVCKKCIYYQNNILNEPHNNKCTQFGTKDVISGKISYTYAEFCRNDEHRCGQEGKQFKEYPNAFTKIRHFLITNKTIVCSILFSIAWIIYH